MDEVTKGGGVWIELQRKFWESLDDVTKGGGDFLLSYNGDFRRG